MGTSRLDHFVGHDAHHGIDGGCADFDLAFGFEFGFAVDGFTGAAEDASEDVVGVVGLLRVTEEADLSVGGEAFAAGEDLEAGDVFIEFDDAGGGGFAVGVFDDGEVTEGDAGGADLDHIADDFEQAGVPDEFLNHVERPGAEVCEGGGAPHLRLERDAWSGQS